MSRKKLYFISKIDLYCLESIKKKKLLKKKKLKEYINMAYTL